MTIPAPKSNNRSIFKTGGLVTQPKPAKLVQPAKKQESNVQQPQQPESKSSEKNQVAPISVQQEQKRSGQVSQQPSDNVSSINKLSLSSGASTSGRGIVNVGNPLPPVGVIKSNPNLTLTPNLETLNVYVEKPGPNFGINLKPEIIFISQFKPIWKELNTLSPEGQKFELEVQTLRKIESDSIELLKNSIGEDTIKETNDAFKVQIKTLKDKMRDLRKNANDFISYKESLNVSDKRYKFLPKKFISKNYPNNESIVPILGGDYSIDLATAVINSRGIINPGLIKDINKFSSSKLFLFCLRELLYSTQGHSNDLLKQTDDSFFSVQGESAVKYDIRSFEEKRLNALNITSNAPDVFTEYGTFQYIEKKLNETLKAAPSAKWIGLVFYLCFNHMIRNVRRFKSASLTLPDTFLNDFIGYYPKDTTPRPIGILAYSDDNVYTGNKLSDLIFFRNLNDSTRKVLTLENYESLFLPQGKKIDTGAAYLFPSIIEVLNDDSKFKDFTDFLDNITDKAFKNFGELEILPISDDEVVKLNRSYKSLNTFNSFTKLFSLFVDNNGSFILSNPIDEKVAKGQKLESGWFQSNDLIALLTFERSIKSDTISTILYRYVIHKVNGEDKTNPGFAETCANEIFKWMSSQATEMVNNSVLPSDPSAALKSGEIFAKECPPSNYYADYSIDQWRAAIVDVLKNGEFTRRLVKFFKQFLDFDSETKLLLFYCAIKMIQSLSTVTVNQIKSATLNTLNQDYPIQKFTLFTVYKPSDKKTTSTYKQNALGTISLEQRKVLDLTFAVLNTLQTLRDNFKLARNDLNNVKQDPYLNRFISLDKIPTLLKESQLLLASTTVEDLYQSFSGFSSENADSNNLFIKREESLSHSTKIVELMRDFFNSDQFRSWKGYNKQIISVGIPQDLFISINNVLKEKKVENYKHNDVFKIIVYKMDLLNPYIVYKPKSFLFEASRFPIRIYSSLKNVNPVKFAQTRILPTRNYSLTNLLENEDSLIADDINNAFDANYSFLTNNEKTEILKNHTTSFLLEHYLKVMSGLNVSELTFNLLSPEEIELLYQSLTDISTNAPIVLQQFVQKQTNPVPPAQLFANITSTTTVVSEEAKNALKLIPNPDPYIKRLIQPKKFDRVFNIIFDPEFEVDKKKMQENLSPNLEDPSLKNLIFASLNDKKRFIYEQSTGKHFDVDKTPNDISFDTYFVTLETHAKLPLT